MRKITRDSINAFLDKRPFHAQNMSVTFDKQYVMLNLHGNCIAKRNLNNNQLEVTTAGWDTPTTKNRLNGLPGVKIWHEKGQMFLATFEYPGGIEWDGEWTPVMQATK